VSPADPTPPDASTSDASEAPGKKGLMGWISGAVSQLEAKAESAAAEATGARPVTSPSGPLPPARHAMPAKPVSSPSGPLPPGPGPAKAGSGPLGGAVRSASLKLPGSGPLRAAGTGELAQRPATPVATPSGPLPLVTPLPKGPDEAEEAAPEAAKPAEDPASASRRRMAFIVAYMKDPAGDPDFADKPLVYRIFAEERDYQQQLVNTLHQQLERLPDGDAEKRADLEQRHKTAQQRQSQLFLQLKKLTGVKGKTGGTGFLMAPDTLPEPKGLGGDT
jgi:hypothetical protein